MQAVQTIATLEMCASARRLVDEAGSIETALLGEASRLAPVRASPAPSVRRRRKMLGRKTLEERIAATIRAEIEKILASLENDHREYLRRLRLKEKTQSALEEAEAEVRRLHSEKTALEKRFWEAHSEESEAALSEIESTSKPLERATKKAEKTLGKTRADFEKA